MGLSPSWSVSSYGVRVLRIANEDVERRLPYVLERIAANLSPGFSPEREW
jgi:hypothetical protein